MPCCPLTPKSTCLELFWAVFACKWCLICAYFSPDSDKTTFSLEKVIIWIEDLFERKKHLKDGFVTNMLLFAWGDVNWWTGVVWITCGLLRCLDSHSDGTHSESEWALLARYIYTYEEFVIVTEAPQCNRMTATGQDTNKRTIYK